MILESYFTYLLTTNNFLVLGKETHLSFVIDPIYLQESFNVFTCVSIRKSMNRYNLYVSQPITYVDKYLQVSSSLLGENSKWQICRFHNHAHNLPHIYKCFNSMYKCYLWGEPNRQTTCFFDDRVRNGQTKSILEDYLILTIKKLVFLPNDNSKP